METGRILQMFNDWFDVLNASSPFTSQKEKCAFGVHFIYQKKILDEMSNFKNETLVFGHKCKLPFQTGILVTNKSLLYLYTYLSQSHKFQFVLTSKLNQDVLENFFSIIRSMVRTNDLPDASQFITRMRWFIMGKHCTTVMSVKHNIEPDNEECLASSDITSIETTSPNTVEEECASAKLLASLLQQSASNNDEEEELSWDLYAAHVIDTEKPTQLEEESNYMKIESLRYVTGYVAFKHQNKFPELGTKDNCASNVTQEFSWIEAMSKGGLRIPSNEFLQCAKTIEESFTQFHGLSLRKESDVKKVKSLVDDKIRVNHLNIPDETVNRFILVRTYIRMRHLNKFAFDNKKEEQKRFSKKLAKIQNIT
uniref:Transposable element P transposase n=1 Tax=Clastoptera arizonana TaxID=38151 RepID=A0A1B6CHC7_9HEMI